MKKLLPLFILALAPFTLLADACTLRNPPSSDEPNKGCTKCGDNSDASNSCVKINVDAGKTAIWADGRSVGLKIFSSDATPSLFTPAQLRVVMGYTFQNLGPDRTSKGAPAEVNFVQSAGAPIRFRFAEGASLAIPDPAIHKDLAERLMMVDAEGWACLKDPAYYDLYPGDGSRWRFLATNQLKSIGELVEMRDARGRTLTQADLGVEIIRDVNGDLAQLLTANRLSNVTLFPADPLVTGYTVHVYPIQTPPEWDDATGRFILPTGTTPTTTLTIQNGVKNNKADPHTLHADIRKGAGATLRYTFTYINGDWTLANPDGTTTKKEIYYGDNDDAHMIEQTLAPNGTPLAQKESLFDSYAWGYAMTNQVEGIGSVTRSTSWQYVTTGPAKGSVSRMEKSSGYWETYQYDSLARKIRTESPVSGMPDHPGATKVVTVSYTPLDPNEPTLLNDTRPRTVIETIAGIETKRTYYSYPTNSLGAHLEIRERCALQGEPYGSTNNLRTVTAYYPPSQNTLLSGRLDYTQSEDGTIIKYDYFFADYTPATGEFVANPDGLYWCQTSTKLHVYNGMQPIPMKTTRTVNIYSANGNRLLQAEQLLAEDSTTWHLLAHTRYTYNQDGKEIRTETNTGHITETQWGQNCCGKAAYTDEQGIRTTYQYDLNNRLIIETKLDPSPIEVHYKYDQIGRQISYHTTNQVERIGSLPLAIEYDALGRVVRQSDTMGQWTDYGYSLDELTRTAILPTGLEDVLARGVDGRSLEKTKTDFHPTSYTYGLFPDGSQWQKQQQGERFFVTVIDLLGRTIRRERPGFNGEKLFDTFVYDRTHRIQVYTFTNDNNILSSTLYTYEADGDLCLTISDLNKDGLYNPAIDRAERKNQFYEIQDGALWHVTHFLQFAKNQERVLRRQRTQISGLEPGTTCEQSEELISGNVTQRFSEIDRAKQVLKKTVFYPGASTPDITTVLAGQTVVVTSRTSVVSLYGYDGLGRQTIRIDGRGNASSVTYNHQGLVASSSDALGNETIYTYDDFGRQISVTDPMGRSIHQKYDIHNRIIEEYGATYPVKYVYDPYGQRIVRQTFRDEVTEPTQTHWIYEAATGFLLQKCNAGSLSVTYTYTPDGKLATRTGARGITTRYQFGNDDQLVSIAYSDETPPVTYVYNDWGEPRLIIDAAGQTAIGYQVSGIKHSETIENAFYTRSLIRTIDGFARPTGYSIGQDSHLSIAYDATTGRPASAASSAGGNFTWQYLAGSDLKAVATYPNGATQTFSYEGGRDLLSGVENKVQEMTLSHYDYINNAAGERIHMSQSGSAMSRDDAFDYTYNLRGELTNAAAETETDDAYAFQFDTAGNRVTSIERGVACAYSTDPLNRYVAVGTFQPQFDADGNQTLIQTSTGIWSVQYNAENRPILWQQGTTTIEMAYDHMGRRVSYKSMTGSTVNRHSMFFYKDYLCLQEIDALTGKTTKEFLWDPTEPTATKPLQIRYSESGKICFYLTDGNKNISEVLNRAGAVEAHYEYAPFGTLTHQTGNLDNPFRFSSEYHDDELGLIYYNYRHYSMRTGRWTSLDPINEFGFILTSGQFKNESIGDSQGLYYLFVGNSPLNNQDHLGLLFKCWNVCSNAKKQGLGKDLLGRDLLGGTVCCCGKAYACVWGTGKHKNKKAIKHIKKCLMMHEEEHLPYSDCPSDGSGSLSRATNDPEKKAFIECKSYKAEYECLKKSLEDKKCKADINCFTQVKEELDAVEKAKDYYCGQVND